MRYVGATTGTLQTRLRRHIQDSRRQKTSKDRWISSLLRAGGMPIITVVESGYGEGMAEAEQRWMAHYRTNGARLTNKGAGGEGCIRWRIVTPAELDAEARAADDLEWDVWEGHGPEDEYADDPSLSITETRTTFFIDAEGRWDSLRMAGSPCRFRFDAREVKCADEQGR